MPEVSHDVLSHRVSGGANADLDLKSTVLTELAAVFGFLRPYRALPPHRLRVFSSPAKEELNEQLARENKEGAALSVTAAQFLQEERYTSFRGKHLHVLRVSAQRWSRSLKVAAAHSMRATRENHPWMSGGRVRWSADGESWNVVQVAIMTWSIPSCFPPPCRNSASWSGCWQASSMVIYNPEAASRDLFGKDKMRARRASRRRVWCGSLELRRPGETIYARIEVGIAKGDQRTQA